MKQLLYDIRPNVPPFSYRKYRLINPQGRAGAGTEPGAPRRRRTFDEFNNPHFCGEILKISAAGGVIGLLAA